MRFFRGFAAVGLASLHFVAANAAAVEPSDAIRSLAAAPRHPDLAWASLDDVRTDLTGIYETTAYAPIWVKDGRPTEQVRAVIDYVAASDTRGLSAADYDAASLMQLSQRLPAGPGDAAARFDTAMTATLLRFLRHTTQGRVDPHRFGFGLDVERAAPDLQRKTLDIARSSEPARDIDSFQPEFPLFQRLLAALALYRELANRAETPPIPDTRTLRPGDSSPAMGAVRAKLQALNDLAPDTLPPEDGTLYDEATAEAVKRFQRRHGLDEDGVVGPATLRALRVSPAERVSQIELAIERLRWLPRQQPERFIVVNIPEFRLSAFERGAEGAVMTSEVVVGSAARRNETPILHSEVKHLVFRPYWNVPPSITRNELLPKERAAPGYLERNNMEMIDGRIRQRPGRDNSLGLVKFIFPNRHHVYLHDTPSKGLFGRSRRDFSHGCIRVARPVDLAEFLLRRQDGWHKERIVRAMDKGRDNQHVRLENPVPIYLLYSTVIAGRDGQLRFYDDIYGHDVDLRKALAKGPPYS